MAPGSEGRKEEKNLKRPTRCRLGLIGALVLAIGALAAVAQAQRPRPTPPGMQPPMQERPGWPPAQSPVQAPLPWVDVHMHLVGGRGGDFGGAVENAVREMDSFGIATAVILPPPQVDSQPFTYDHTAYAGALRRHPGRFAFLGGGGTLNATIHRYADPAKVTERVKTDFAAAAERLLDGGASGFGEMASLHISAMTGHPYEFVPADHPLFLVLADVAARRDVPIDLHMDAAEGGMPTPPRWAGGANPPTLPAPSSRSTDSSPTTRRRRSCGLTAAPILSAR